MAEPESAIVDVAARWESQPNVALATFDLVSKQNVVAPDEYPVFYNANAAVRTWIAPLGRLREIQCTGTSNGAGCAIAVVTTSTSWPRSWR